MNASSVKKKNGSTISFICYILWSLGLHNKTWKWFHAAKKLEKGSYTSGHTYSTTTKTLEHIEKGETIHNVMQCNGNMKFFALLRASCGGITHHRTAPNGHTNQFAMMNKVMWSSQRSIVPFYHENTTRQKHMSTAHVRQFTGSYLPFAQNTLAKAHLYFTHKLSTSEAGLFFPVERERESEGREAIFRRYTFILYDMVYSLLLPVISTQWKLLLILLFTIRCIFLLPCALFGPNNVKFGVKTIFCCWL